MPETKKLLLPPLLLCCLISVALPQSYRAGFRVVSVYDSNRIYKQQTSASDKLHFRPIDADVWYPSEVVSNDDTTVSFNGLVRLLEQRGNFYDDTANYSGLTDELLQYVCAASACSDYHMLKKLNTNSFVNVKPAKGRFPLILYFAAFNGMSYENYLLFEALAEKGFVVASISSIGRYPGHMTMDFSDLFEQIKDGEFVARHLLKEMSLTPELGVIGYSWGGLAGSMMAMNGQFPIKAIVSLDGSEQFTYSNAEENEKLNRIRYSDFFKPEAIHSRFLFLDSDIDSDNRPDSIYNFYDFVRSDKCYLNINHSTHGDFSGLSVVGKIQNNTRHDLIKKLTVNYLLDAFKDTDFFYKNIPGDSVTKQFFQPSVVRKKNVLRGIISDSKTNLPLAYANIGICNKDRGTTSNEKGKFALTLAEQNSLDTLHVSIIGYEPKIFYLKDIFSKGDMYLNIRLEEQPNQLREVKVVGKKLSTKILGNKTHSKFFGGRFSSGDLGAEVAVKLKVKRSPIYLESFGFNISYNTTRDTATFRVNVYSEKNGMPDQNILTESIIVRINGRAGKIEVDLSKYNIVLNDDFFIALEWIEGQTNSGIVFSAGLANKGSYYRKASHGRWKKYPMGVGFHVTAKY